MPSISEEVLIMVAEGVYYFINPYALFRVGLPYRPQSLYKAIERLHKKGLIKKQTKERKIYLELTEEGRRLVRDHRISTRRSRQKWDGNWRMVIFDVPECRREARRYLRDFLVTLGFGKVQRSVWISPYDFEHRIDKFVRKLNLSDYLCQLTVNKFMKLAPRDIAKRVWRLEELHNRYLNFIKRYSLKLNRARKSMEQNQDMKSVSWKIFLNSLLWDYHALLARDPLLPSQLLPESWGGHTARAFVEKCQASEMAAEA